MSDIAALRLTGDEKRPVQAVADAEHGGELSAAIRALVAEALAARAQMPHEHMLHTPAGACETGAVGVCACGQKFTVVRPRRYAATWEPID